MRSKWRYQWGEGQLPMGRAPDIIAEITYQHQLSMGKLLSREYLKQS